jgi:hypothetical protein
LVAVLLLQSKKVNAEPDRVMPFKQLALDLSARFGRGFGWRNLFQMRAFFLAWPEILQTLSAISRNSNPLAQIDEKFPIA